MDLKTTVLVDMARANPKSQSYQVAERRWEMIRVGQMVANEKR